MHKSCAVDSSQYDIPWTRGLEYEKWDGVLWGDSVSPNSLDGRLGREGEDSIASVSSLLRVFTLSGFVVTVLVFRAFTF